MSLRLLVVPLLLSLLVLACRTEAETQPPPVLDGEAELIEVPSGGGRAQPVVPAVAGANRASCAAIRGTDYISYTERAWFLVNCLAGGGQANRASCDAIRGTGYLSEAERSWFIDQCNEGDAPLAANVPQPQGRVCHPSYAGACLAMDIGNYSCWGRGPGPNFVRGRIRVVGPDVFQLDRDGNGIGCE